MSTETSFTPPKMNVEAYVPPPDNRPRVCGARSIKGRTPHVAVVGGGIAGLSSAYLLLELAREAGKEVQVTVFEAAAQPGGATRTELRDGFVCEWGPNGFLDNEPATLELVDRLELRDRLQKADPSAAHRFIYHTGKMREVPATPPAFLKSDILPFGAKLRIGLERLIPPRRDETDESVDSFGRRRLGATFAQYLLDPMVSGIYAGNTAELSLPAVFPKMREMELQYGGLFKALFAKQREAKRNGKRMGGPAGPSATLHTFRQGMGELTGTLAARLQDRIHLFSPVRAVLPQDDGWRLVLEGGPIDFDGLVLACPSYASAALVEGFAPETAKALRGIRHAPVDVVCQGYASEGFAHPLEGFGVLIPRHEGLRSLGNLWCDAIFPGQAPEGRHLIRTILGGAHDPDIVTLSERDLEETAIQDHRTLFGLNEKPDFSRVFRHPRGIAQYTLGHLDRVAQIDTLERTWPGLYFTGASYRGVSVNGCVKDAFRVAHAMWGLEERRSPGD